MVVLDDHPWVHAEGGVYQPPDRLRAWSSWTTNAERAPESASISLAVLDVQASVNVNHVTELDAEVAAGDLKREYIRTYRTMIVSPRKS